MVSYAATWANIILHVPAWSNVVSNGHALSCIMPNGPSWTCIALMVCYVRAWFCMVLHEPIYDPAWFCMVFEGIKVSQILKALRSCFIYIWLSKFGWEYLVQKIG